MSSVFAGAEEAGRDPSEIEISIVCAMWVSDDVDEARRHCRWAAASAANHIEEVMRRPGHDMPEELTRIVESRRKLIEQYSYDSHLENTDEETAFLTDDMIDDLGIAGDAPRCAERIRELAALGVGETASGFLNGELEQIAHVGAELVPRLESATVAAR
jgi:alkanesulfonate monooxygenase SsuD/methylene tetrahydromethanopterin reductase-like flavin-dependent oxidoreductase (luciferase family)